MRISFVGAFRISFFHLGQVSTNIADGFRHVRCRISSRLIRPGSAKCGRSMQPIWHLAKYGWFFCTAFFFLGQSSSIALILDDTGQGGTSYGLTCIWMISLLVAWWFLWCKCLWENATQVQWTIDWPSGPFKTLYIYIYVYKLDIYIYIPSLKLTATAPENRPFAPKGMDHLNQASIFRCQIAVRFREGTLEEFKIDTKNGHILKPESPSPAGPSFWGRSQPLVWLGGVYTFIPLESIPAALNYDIDPR